MSKNKYTTAFCVALVVLTLVITVAFMAGSSWGVEIVHNKPPYAEGLFNTERVHTIDIVVKESDWDEMIANAQAEEYIKCAVIIDGDSVKGVGIRPKGNSSLSMIARSDSDRYSFKIEFDHYQKGKNYFGLDKLALNNIAQDNTYMKDYISYQMMNAMGAEAPLSSFIWVTVNGRDWGLYLAAEGIEESFAQRVYGRDFGQIYKPESMDMGNRQRENGGDDAGGFPGLQGGRPRFGEGEMPPFEEMPGGRAPEGFGRDQRIPNLGQGEAPNFGGEIPQIPGGVNGGNGNFGAQIPGFGGGAFGGFGGGATSLLYLGDDSESYAAIFDHALFKPKEADKKRLIKSLKQLNAGENLEQVVDAEEVIRYFVVHNFVLNADSYTGSLTHNYYLAENNGKLSMIAWDYNLAFGGMGTMFGGNGDDSATRLVNYPMDSPMLAGSIDEKPMIAWIFNNDNYLAEYHRVFSEYEEYLTGGGFVKMYDSAIALISPYVEKDPSAFCTFEEFKKGSSALREFCLLRAESIGGQLDGTIACTSEGQSTAQYAGFIDASGIDLESMGSNSMGFDRARGGRPAGWNENNETNSPPPAWNEEAPAQGLGGFAEGGVAEGEMPGLPPDGGGHLMPDLKRPSNEVSETPTPAADKVMVLALWVAVLAGGIVFAKRYWV